MKNLLPACQLCVMTKTNIGIVSILFYHKILYDILLFSIFKPSRDKVNREYLQFVMINEQFPFGGESLVMAQQPNSGMSAPEFYVTFGLIKKIYKKTQGRREAVENRSITSNERCLFVRNGVIEFNVRANNGILDGNEIIAYVSRTDEARRSLPSTIDGKCRGLLQVYIEQTNQQSVKCYIDMGTLRADSGTHPVLRLNTNNTKVTNVYSLKVCYESLENKIGESHSFLLTSDKPRQGTRTRHASPPNSPDSVRDCRSPTTMLLERIIYNKNTDGRAGVRSLCTNEVTSVDSVAENNPFGSFSQQSLPELMGSCNFLDNPEVAHSKGEESDTSTSWNSSFWQQHRQQDYFPEQCSSRSDDSGCINEGFNEGRYPQSCIPTGARRKRGFSLTKSKTSTDRTNHKIPLLSLHNQQPQPQSSGVRLGPGQSHDQQRSGEVNRIEEGNRNPSTFDHIHSRSIYTESLRARWMQVGRCVTPNGDISYRIHCALSLAKDKFLDEGMLVALFEDAHGRPILERLTRENIKSAILTGVITRSAYVESRSLADEEPSDIIAVLGFVDVYIRGSVSYGDVVLADYEMPGIGISKPNWDIRRSQNSSDFEAPHLVGTAMGTIVSSENEDEIQKVKCLISLPLTRTYREHEQQIEKSKRDCENQLNTSKRKIYRRTCCGVISAMTFLILLGVMIHQFVARGTAFQYAMCRSHAQSSVPVCLKFNSPLDGESIIVKGYKFKYEDLQKKLKLKTSTLEQSLDLPLQERRINYYLNVDRCAYMRPWFRNRKENKGILIRGIEVFATYKNNSRNTVYGIDDNQWDRFKRKVKFLPKCPDEHL